MILGDTRWTGLKYSQSPTSTAQQPSPMKGKDIILGVVEGTITSYAIEFEDYPSDKTKRRWVTEFHSG